jgi:hypothetical protein
LSTVDPAVERRRKALEESRQEPGGGAGFGLFLVFAAWALFGLGLADTIRYPMGLLYLTPDLYPANVVPGMFWAVFVGSIAGFVLDFGFAAAVTSRFGLGAGFSLPAAVTLIGCAVGFWLGASLFWVVAPEPGVFAAVADGGASSVGGDFWAGSSEGFTDATPPGERTGPWDAGAWIAWTARYWAPALLVLIGAGLAWFGRNQARAESRRRARAKAVIETGIKTRDLITELHDTGVEIMNQPRLRVVVKFTDHQGVDRWVTKTDNFDAVQLPRVGDPVVVWFDPADPGDESSIPIAFGAATEVEEALGAKTGVRGG